MKHGPAMSAVLPGISGGKTELSRFCRDSDDSENRKMLLPGRHGRGDAGAPGPDGGRRCPGVYIKTETGEAGNDAEKLSMTEQDPVRVNQNIHIEPDRIMT